MYVTKYKMCTFSQETFNQELVNETEGVEDYVHLKSLEDEFHYVWANVFFYLVNECIRF